MKNFSLSELRPTPPEVPDAAEDFCAITQRKGRTVTEKIFDYPAVLARLGGDESLFQDLVTYFLEDAPDILEEVLAGVRAGDAEAIEQAAHRLKGLTVNFSAHAAIAAAQELENIGRSQDLTEAVVVGDRLQAEIAHLIQALPRPRNC